MTYQDLQQSLKNKTFLIGLTFVDSEGKLLEQYQTQGIVSQLTDDGLFKFLRKDGTTFQMPYDPKTIQKAEKGAYNLRASGEIVTDPDYLMTWEIVTQRGEFDDVKAYGYIP